MKIRLGMMVIVVILMTMRVMSMLMMSLMMTMTIRWKEGYLQPKSSTSRLFICHTSQMVNVPVNEHLKHFSRYEIEFRAHIEIFIIGIYPMCTLS